MNYGQQQYDNNYPLGNIETNKPINWRKYFFLFLTNWYWFLITVFVAMSIAYLKTRYQNPVYKATATLLIEDEEGTSDFLSEIRSVRRRRRTGDLTNEIAKLNAFSLHRRTIDSLRWDIFWTAHGRIAMERPIYHRPPYYIEIDKTSESWYLNHKFYIDQQDEYTLKFYNKNGIDTLLLMDTWNEINDWKFRIYKSEYPVRYASYSFTIYNQNTITKSLRSKLVYQADDEEGTVITVSSEGVVPDREIDYINALCENFIQAGLERKRLIAENTLDFIEEQINIIKDSLNITEKQMLAYRLDQNAVDLSREGQMAYEKLQNFYEQKTQLKLKSNYYEYLKDYIENKRDPQAIISPTLIDANDQLLIGQVKSLQTLYDEREKLAFSASVENPGITQINDRIQSMRTKIIDILDGLVYSNELARMQIVTEENDIEQQLLRLPVSEQELINIQRKYDVNNQFYTFLLERRAEAGIQRASAVSQVRILDHANIFNIIPVGTKKSLIYLIAIIFGLVVPGSIIYLANTFDTRIKDRRDIEENTDLPILGVISHSTIGEDIPVHHKPGDVFAESFRHIRTNLQYILRESEQKIIMITSTISGEGKTFIAVNLATILAMADKKVLLIGMDLRRPSLHKVFKLENSKGISTFLAGMDKYSDIISPTNIEGINVMVSGQVPPNPAELLGTDKMSELFNNAKKHYDYIVIDTPPIALVTDALLISKYADANILIIRQNFSPKGVLEMINNLKSKQIREISLLVNDIRESKAFGYRYYYGYGYGYGYGYHYRYGNKYYTDSSEDIG